MEEIRPGGQENHGVVERPVGAKDYHAGGVTALPKDVVLVDGDWRPYKSDPHEMQLRFGRDFNSCTNFAATDTVEALLFKLFGIRANYSDRALAILSDQGPTGNGLGFVAEAIRTCGLVAEETLPWTAEQDTFQKFITCTAEERAHIEEEGKKWLAQYEFGYEWVYDNWGPSMREMLKLSPLFAAGLYASESGKDASGIYRTDLPNSPMTTHAFVLLNQQEDGLKDIDDSYATQVKRLAPDFRVPIGMRFYIAKKNPNPMPAYYPPANCKVVVVDTGERLMYVGGDSIYSDEAGKIEGELMARNSVEVPGKKFLRANGYPLVHVHAKDITHLKRIKLNGQPA